MRVRFTRFAKADLREARRWYRGQARGLDDALMRSIEACMESIELLPRAYPLVHGQTRKALVARFPYALFFSVDGDVVVVEAVFHTARDPRWLHERWN